MSGQSGAAAEVRRTTITALFFVASHAPTTFTRAPTITAPKRSSCFQPRAHAASQAGSEWGGTAAEANCSGCRESSRLGVGLGREAQRFARRPRAVRSARGGGLGRGPLRCWALGSPREDRREMLRRRAQRPGLDGGLLRVRAVPARGQPPIMRADRDGGPPEGPRQTPHQPRRQAGARGALRCLRPPQDPLRHGVQVRGAPAAPGAGVLRRSADRGAPGVRSLRRATSELLSASPPRRPP